MITQRFNINRVWDDVEISHRQNIMFMGFTNLLNDLVAHFFTSDKDDYKRMIEIGAYMGESTFLFGCSGIFKEINTIEPHKGKEEFNDMFEYTWDDVKFENEKNTRHFNNINHHKDIRYNKALVESVSDDIKGLSKGDIIYVKYVNTLLNILRGVRSVGVT